MTYLKEETEKERVTLKMTEVNWSVTEEDILKFGMQLKFQDLVAAQATALKIDAARSKFLATVSHEIRTPLNGIIGMTSLLMDTEQTSEQREFTKAIFTSGQTLLALINDILDFSKIEAGKMQLDYTEFDFLEHIKDICKPFYFLSKEKGLYFQMHVPEGPFKVLGDKIRIGQIVTNLLGNAFKFTQQGGVTFKIEVCDEKSDYVKVVFIFQDTGIGIPENAHSKLFQAFHQADCSTSRRFGGTGLGLSICKQLVELMQGKISFESQLGQGSTFRVEIPFKKSENSDQDIIPSKFLITENKKNEIKAGRILIVEDDYTNQRVISRMVQNIGYNYHVVSNGKEALNDLGENQFDLILMDCQMPEMDGYETTSFIRSSNSFFKKNIPIIALTANALQEDEARCLEAGMNGYLTKPINQNALAVLLKKYLEDKQNLLQ